MGFEFAPMIDFGLDRAADLLTRGFADYFVKIPFTPPMLLQLARGDSVDFGASIVVMQDGRPLGAALVARRGWTSRIAGMALLNETGWCRTTKSTAIVTCRPPLRPTTSRTPESG